DVTLVNTCIVTQRASTQSRQALRRAIRENPSGRTAALGCYAQVYPEELSGIKGLDLIIDNKSKGRVPGLLKAGKSRNLQQISEAFPAEVAFEDQPIKSFLDRTRAFLKIQDGCRSYCTYCIVPLARGPLRSLDPLKVLRSLQSLSEEGYREVVLTGIHLGKYGADLARDLGLKGLLKNIGKENLPLRIRLSSIEPNEIDRELIEIAASEERICRHFHIPLQSGDDGILKRMNRPYTAGEFRDLVQDIHTRIPLAAIGVDVMVGFPGEDERAFENTHALIRDLPISYLHVFPFSPRKGTPAVDFPDQVEVKTARERAEQMRRLGQEKRKAFYRSCLGRTFTVLAQGWESEEKGMVKGLSDNYLPIQFRSERELVNSFLSVQVEQVREEGIFGIPVGKTGKYLPIDRGR
ncbi:MAG: tRNA (N(6)-L-threonylcarbamoyladenosine(37)-C(2))-methylthiotransferase MtaB, partial [Pseudomonadota bacterium]